MYTQGNSESYDVLVDQFNTKKTALDTPSPIPQLRQWLHALIHVVSRLDRTHMALIDAITRFPWMTMDSGLVKTYTSFIEILVSARPEYLSLVLGRIAQGFTYRASFPNKIEFVADSTLVLCLLGKLYYFRIGSASSRSWSPRVLFGTPYSAHSLRPHTPPIAASSGTRSDTSIHPSAASCTKFSS